MTPKTRSFPPRTPVFLPKLYHTDGSVIDAGQTTEEFAAFLGAVFYAVQAWEAKSQHDPMSQYHGYRFCPYHIEVDWEVRTEELWANRLPKSDAVTYQRYMHLPTPKPNAKPIIRNFISKDGEVVSMTSKQFAKEHGINALKMAGLLNGKTHKGWRLALLKECHHIVYPIPYVP